MASRTEPGSPQADGSGVGEIEDGIPFPAKRGRPLGPVAERVKALGVGQSVWIAAKHEWCARWHAKKAGIVIALRAENGGFRIWRRV